MNALSHMSVMFSRPRFRGKLKFHVEGAALVAQIVEIPWGMKWLPTPVLLFHVRDLNYDNATNLALEREVEFISDHSVLPFCSLYSRPIHEK